MTHGYAQPRSKLPWLPYESLDRVIINSHNFTPAAFDSSVNGKTPDGCWCPSQDSAGRLTATLTDLVGVSDGTLTNMDPATDWVNDTGSLWNLDFDGTNDEVIIGDVSAYDIATASFSVSAWINTSSSKTVQAIFAKQDSSSFNGFFFGLVNGQLRLVNNWGASLGSVGTITSTGTFNNGAWRHVVGVMIGADRTNWRLYVDGISMAFTEADSDLTGTGVGNTALLRIGSRDFPGNTFHGSIDDVRAWISTALDASDVTALYAGGLGRGVSV